MEESKNSDSKPANSATNDAPEDKPETSSSTNKTCECNICFDAAQDAVVGFCGHLFWYPLITSFFRA